MNRPPILIMEDDRTVRNLIATTLEMYDYHYIQADREEQDILSAASQKPGIILLDLGLPDMDGVDVAPKIRSQTNTPIIAISTRSEDSGETVALDVETDDYLTKPFSVGELLTRLRFTQRRLSYMQSLGEVQTSLLANGGLTIDCATGCACPDGEGLHLTPYEYKLLCLLVRNVEKVLTHSYITREIWGAAWERDVASFRIFMVFPRRKIEKSPSQPQYIQTRVGVGYRMMKR